MKKISCEMCGSSDLIKQDGVFVCENCGMKYSLEDAKKNIINVPRVNTTIPHDTVGVYGGGKVVLRPASEGTGVIAGGPVRAVLELAGVADILSKSLGSNTPINMVRATMDGLKQLKRAEDVAKLRGKSVEELLG